MQYQCSVCHCRFDEHPLSSHTWSPLADSLHCRDLIRLQHQLWIMSSRLSTGPRWHWLLRVTLRGRRRVRPAPLNWLTTTERKRRRVRSCEEVKRKEAQRGIVNAYEETQMRGGGGKKKKTTESSAKKEYVFKEWDWASSRAIPVPGSSYRCATWKQIQ